MFWCITHVNAPNLVIITKSAIGIIMRHFGRIFGIHADIKTIMHGITELCLIRMFGYSRLLVFAKQRFIFVLKIVQCIGRLKAYITGFKFMKWCSKTEFDTLMNGWRGICFYTNSFL